MNEVKFILQHKEKEQTTVYLRYNIFINGKNKPFIQSIGESVITEHWDASNMRLNTRVSPRTLSDQNRKINAKLDQWRNRVEAAINYLLDTGSAISRESIKERLKVNGTTAQKEKLTDHFDHLIQQRESGLELTKKGTIYRKATIKQYKASLQWLRNYEQHYDTVLYADRIDMTFYNAFVSMLNKQGKSINLIDSKIKHIKMLIKYLNRNNFTDNRIFENDSFKRINETADTIYLNDAEVDVLWQLDLTGYLRKARDIFLIGCYTGMRYSDYSNLVKENIIDGNILKIVTDKLSQIEYIPIHHRVKQIIDHYDGRAPAGISNQKLNEYIKEVAYLAGIHQKEQLNVEPTFFESQIFRITKGGQIVEEVFMKYQKITTHTARRSFATNAYLAGIDSISIMKITGHKTEESFMKYIKVTKKQNAVRMLQHSWFK